MAKPPSRLIGADSRPRVYLRQRGDMFEASRADIGPWSAIDSLHDAIDMVVGEGAHTGEAVSFWKGIVTDA